ncbi:MAG: GNAT family N-acetyltransferase [Saprospiraceae bacterium]
MSFYSEKLSAPMVKMLRTNIRHPKFKFLVEQLDQELVDMYGEQMEFFSPHNILKEDTFALVALQEDEPVAIGAFREMNKEGDVEIKRMFVPIKHRSKGFSKLILKELENWAKEENYIYSKLETGDKNVTAISLYLSAGYEKIDLFEPYIGIENSLCFAKKI